MILLLAFHRDDNFSHLLQQRGFMPPPREVGRSKDRREEAAEVELGRLLPFSRVVKSARYGAAIASRELPPRDRGTSHREALNRQSSSQRGQRRGRVTTRKPMRTEFCGRTDTLSTSRSYASLRPVQTGVAPRPQNSVLIGRVVSRKAGTCDEAETTFTAMKYRPMKCNPNSLGKIFHKSRASEFEIQATIWKVLNEAGFTTRGEVTAKHLCGSKVRRCKFDLVVFDGKHAPLAVIEVKRWGKSTANAGILVNHQSAQAEKYRSFGFPVIYCGHMENIPLVVDEIRRLSGSSAVL